MMANVCVVVPTYNGATFLEEALQSILQQTYTNFEVVISDDHSTDRTLEIVKSFAMASPFAVHILQHNRLGLVENWNYCVQFVRTRLPNIKYLKFLFQDDLLTPDCLEKMLAITAQEPKIGMVFAQRFLMGEVPASLAWLRNLPQHWHKLQPLQNGIELLQDPHLLHPPDNKIGEPSAVLIAMSVFEQIGDFDQHFRQFGDLEMWFRIMANYPIAYLDQELAGFRLHSAQTTWQNKDLVWSEIYGVWYKLLTDSVYQHLPPSVKQRIFNHVYRELGRECLRMIRHRQGHRFSQVVSWLQKFVYARFISAP